MKDWQNFDTTTQDQALLNELKGNLFEYLVGQYLARAKGIESTFLRNFGGEAKDRLQFYQSWVREIDPLLYQQLPLLAKKAHEHLTSLLPQKIDHILVVGKALNNPLKNGEFKEADLLIGHGDGEIPISLKLCKNKAFVNTKSGGILSFFTRYFSHPSLKDLAQEQQNILNEKVHHSFSEMGHELYQQYQLDFEGQFDEHWQSLEIGDLPGQLPEHLRPYLFEHYHRVIGDVYKGMEKLRLRAPEIFGQCCMPLLGLGHKDMIQLTCFHEGARDKGHLLRQFHTLTSGQMEKELPLLKIKTPKKGLASFEVEFTGLSLQIRVKPMNVFTTPALKVNCSVRLKE